MKKIFNITLSALAILSIACTKEIATPDDQLAPNEGQEQVTPSTGKTMTITATLTEALTKVSFDPTFDSGSKPAGMSHTWEAGDQLRVTDANDPSDTQIYDLDPACVGTATGTFTGPVVEATSYNVEVIPNGSFETGNMQVQAKDGDTAHLEFVASATGVTDLSDIQLTETSSIIGIIAKLPANVAATINLLVIETSTDDFASSTKLTVSLTDQEDADTDDILKVYANVPAGWTIPAGAKMFLRFGSTNASHDVYTRYQEFATAAAPVDGKFNYIKMNCSNIDKYAGGADDGTDAHPYLIADPYQLAAINSYASKTEKTYFKMIDDVDMSGVTHTPINEGVDGYSILVDFDGNGMTISNLGKSLFYVFKGSVYDLTLDQSNVTSRGILAEYIQGSGNEITDVTVSNGKVTSSSNNVGGLIGTINSTGTSATITDCTVSDTDVSGAGVVGGVIGFADALVTISGCTYTGGDVEATARYAGGMIASTSNYESVISDCHVEDATITSSSDRAGGFAGLLQTKVQVKGCSVGTSSGSVTVNSTQTSATANVGGFVGVNYGLITKNGDVRTKAYVKVTSSNSTIGNSMNIGGFAGYNTGTIEYSDAEVDMTGLKGQYIGGFCGILLQKGKIENCTETGAVTGNNYIGGFVGVIDSATTSITNCTSAGSVTAASSIGGFAGGCTANSKPGTFVGNSTSATVTSSGSNFGGFIGNCAGTFTSNHATGDVASTGGGNGGGFAGGIWEGSTGSVFSKNYATGNVSGNANLGGLIGYIGGNMTMSDCYATGNVGNDTKYNQKYGGLVGFISDNATNITEGVSITNCYATGDIIPSFAGGGLIGRIGLATTSVSKCVAWNATISPKSTGSENWSSGAVVGVAFPKCTLTDNYRNPSMSLNAYWVPADMTNFQHADVSSTHPLTDSTGAEMADTSTAKGQSHYPQYPYHGKVEAGKTLSQLASTTLGWDNTVWDFTGDLPTLK